jgi:SAM-dependent methyltransferase
VFDVALRPKAPAPEVDVRGCRKVLDVGCGNRPFPAATHLADVTLDDHTERFGYPIPLDDRPFVECSVESMPYDDTEFDYVYCSHVLEHVDQPDVACRELMRVGARGYIETPRSWVEYVFSAEGHKWLVDDEQDTLIFREKLPSEASGDPLGIRYEIFDWLEDARFRERWNSREVRALRNVEFHWSDEFQFVVIPAAERRNSAVR